MSLTMAQLAVLLTLMSSVAALVFARQPRFMISLSFFLLGLSGLVAVAAGGMALLGNQVEQTILPIGLPWLHVCLHIDALAAFFLFIVGFVTFVASCYGPSYISRHADDGVHAVGTLTFFTGLFVGGMYLVLLAADAFSFMIAWELMSVASYFLVAYQHDRAENRSAAFIYLLMAVVGGAFILLSYGVLAGFSDGFSFASMAKANLTPAWATIAFSLAFVGFGLKAGIVPLHVWLPQAHPVAPSHISALMSGVMLKVAVYGFIRFVFDLLGGIHWQWGVLVLLVGAISALMGVLYALMQHDLKRLLAYHSVENIGIIYIGLGLSMIFTATNHKEVAAIALVAALYHCLNHALFKSLLFLGAGAVLEQSGQHNMEHMGGLIKKMPVTAACFLVGCVSICALPPFNGFVSEWLIYQAALQGTVLKSGILGTALPITSAMLALTGALAIACFVKVYGVVFLGLPRTEKIHEAHEVPRGMQFSQIILSISCLVFGIFPTWTANVLNVIPQKLLGTGFAGANGDSWLWLTPISKETASYGALPVLIGLLISWVVVYFFLHPPTRDNSIRIAPAWDCGFGPLNARMQYTATSFAMPIRRIFSFAWHVSEKVEPAHMGKGPHYFLHVSDWVWMYAYAPIGKIIHKVAERTARIQGGDLRIYLCYSFFTLLFLLWVIV
ncbi:MAG: hydrogenase 4 subunit B [Bdellovibrionales bacterium]